MIVADAAPVIALARLGSLALLQHIMGHLPLSLMDKQLG